MTAKRLNIICCEEQCVLQYFPGTETDALIHAVMGRFRLDHSIFYLKEPTFNNVVPLSSTLPDDFTVIVHAVTIPAPALAGDCDAIKENEKTVDDVMDDGTDEDISWGGSQESQEHEDDDEEDVKKEEEDKDMREVIKKRRLGSRSSRKIFCNVPRPPSPPSYRCAYSRENRIPPPPVARNVILSAKSK